MSTTTVLRDPRRYKTLEEAYRIAERGDGDRFHKFHFGGGAGVFVLVDSEGWVLVAANNQGAYPGTLDDTLPVNVGSNSILHRSVIIRVPDVKELRITAADKADLLMTSDNPNIISRFIRYKTMSANFNESPFWNAINIPAGTTKEIKGKGQVLELNEIIYGGNNPVPTRNEINWMPKDGRSWIFRGQNTRLQLWMRWKP